MKTMAVMPSSIFSGSPESTPFKKPEIFKITERTYPEIFSEDDLFKPPIDSTTNTSSFNEEEVRIFILKLLLNRIFDLKNQFLRDL